MAVAEQAGGLLEGMLGGVEKTATLVEEISAASSEQADGIEQVSHTIQAFDQAIQQNAASSEQMASTSRDFKAQAENLLRIAAFFRVSDADAFPEPASRANGFQGTALSDKPPPAEEADPTEDSAEESMDGFNLDRADPGDFEKY
jgi:methyl-accepting chemotaxis protein